MKKEDTNREIVLYTFKVSESTHLLPFLLSKLKQSRNNTKMILKKRAVLLNGLVVTKFDLELSRDDEIKILKYGRKQEKTIKTLKPPFKIIFENDDFLAIDKPINITSEISDKHTSSCFTILQNYLFSKDKNLRIYPLHRLDFETSGVLAFAKNKKVLTQLKLRWNELLLSREYLFLTNGVLNKDTLSMETYLEKTDTDLMKITKDKTKDLAITNYTVLKSSNKNTLGLAYLKTGKKHQIRVQLSYLGLPILGDRKYSKNLSDPLNRLCLHATKLVIKHPLTHKILSIESPCPTSFYKLVNYTL